MTSCFSTSLLPLTRMWMVSPIYSHDLSTVTDVTDPLGIHWHPIEAKGQDFNSTVSYIGFVWDLECHSVSLSPRKCQKYLSKVHSFLHVANSKISWKECMSIVSTLQHISFIYKEGHSTLPPFSAFLSNSPMTSPTNTPLVPSWQAYAGEKPFSPSLTLPHPQAPSYHQP